MSRDLDSVISNWNQKIAEDNTDSKVEFERSVFEELQNLTKHLDEDPEKFESFSVEKDGHLAACVDYSKSKNSKCICPLILGMVKEAVRIREQFRNQFKQNSEEDNN